MNKCVLRAVALFAGLFIVVNSTSSHADALRKEAENVWSELRRQNPELDRAGWFEEPMLRLIRSPIESELVNALNGNQIIKAIRPEVEGMMAREAEYTIATFEAMGFQRLRTDEPGRYATVAKEYMAAIRSTGFSNIDPKDVYIYVIPSEVVNAFMASSRLTTEAGVNKPGKIVGAVFAKNFQRFTNGFPNSAIYAHEFGHWEAMHMRTTFEWLVTVFLLGESAIQKSYVTDVASGMPSAQAEAMKAARLRDLRTFVAQRLIHDRFFNKISDAEVARVFGLNEGIAPSEMLNRVPIGKAFIEYAQKVRAVFSQPGAPTVEKAFSDIAVVGLPKAERKAAVAALRSSKGMTVEQFIAIVKRYLSISRSMEATADRFQLFRGKDPIAALKAAQHVDMMLSTGGGMSGSERPSDAEVAAWKKRYADALRRLETDPVNYEWLRDFEQMTHPFTPARSALDEMFVQTQNFRTLHDPMERLLDFYVFRAHGYLKATGELDRYGPQGFEEKEEGFSFENDFEDRSSKDKSAEENLKDLTELLKKKFNDGLDRKKTLDRTDPAEVAQQFINLDEVAKFLNQAEAAIIKLATANGGENPYFHKTLERALENPREMQKVANRLIATVGAKKVNEGVAFVNLYGEVKKSLDARNPSGDLGAIRELQGMLAKNEKPAGRRILVRVLGAIVNANRRVSPDHYEVQRNSAGPLLAEIMLNEKEDPSVRMEAVNAILGSSNPKALISGVPGIADKIITAPVDAKADPALFEKFSALVKSFTEGKAGGLYIAPQVVVKADELKKSKESGKAPEAKDAKKKK
jgi:hypothetical protein